MLAEDLVFDPFDARRQAQETSSHARHGRKRHLIEELGDVPAIGQGLRVRSLKIR
jgi:hypothetical protein